MVGELGTTAHASSSIENRSILHTQTERTLLTKLPKGIPESGRFSRFSQGYRNAPRGVQEQDSRVLVGVTEAVLPAVPSCDCNCLPLLLHWALSPILHPHVVKMAMRDD